MRAYRVTVQSQFRFAANQTDARRLRAELAAELGAAKRAGDIEEVEVPTAKSDLLQFINSLLDEAGEHA